MISRIIPPVVRTFWRVLVAALTLAVVCGTAPGVLAQPQPQRIGVPPAEGDYAIPNGHFFTQSAPGQQGNGYRVANEAGIPFPFSAKCRYLHFHQSGQNQSGAEGFFYSSF